MSILHRTRFPTSLPRVTSLSRESYSFVSGAHGNAVALISSSARPLPSWAVSSSFLPSSTASSATLRSFATSTTLPSSSPPSSIAPSSPSSSSSTVIPDPNAVAALATPIVPQLLVNPNFHPTILRKQEQPRKKSTSLLLGAVAYCEAISSIWKGIARHFYRQGLDVDFVLFTSYERLQDALLQKNIHIAWNGPLAHGRLIRLLQKNGKVPLSLGMRDVDRDFRTHIIVRTDAHIASLSDLAHRRIAVGTVDSPQAYIMPLEYLHRHNVPLNTLSVFRFDRDIGKHGDTAYGEDSTLEALVNGTTEAGFISDLMWQRYVTANKIPVNPATNQPLLQILPLPQPIVFDHCQFDALPSLSASKADAFQKALLSMDGSGHPEDKRTLELEGIKATWLPPRTVGQPEIGYENMLNALSTFKEPIVRYPGIVHTHQRHPFKHLMIDTRVVLDSFGC